jgi:hypothetical protein
MRIVEFVVDTKTYCLKICPEIENKTGVSRYFAMVIGQKIFKRRISVIGSIICLINMPACWRSKSQRKKTFKSSIDRYSLSIPY